MSREVIYTERAPMAIGTYSQAVRCGKTIYCSGQIPLDAKTMEMVNGSIDDEIHQVFKNLSAVISAGGGAFRNVAKLGIFLTDLGYFARVNEIMAEYFDAPYPARAAVGVASLPKGARVEADAIVVLD